MKKQVIFYLLIAIALSNLTNAQNAKPPYPIIFVHGWAGSDEAWQHNNGNWLEHFEGFGWTYGGRINVCLEMLSISLHDEANSDVSIVYEQNPEVPLGSGDFYFLNFDVNKYLDLYPDPRFGIEDLQTADGTTIYISSLNPCEDIHIGDIIVVGPENNTEFMIVEDVNYIFNVVYSIVVERGALGSAASPHFHIEPSLYLSARNLSNMSNQGSMVKGGTGIKKAIQKIKDLNPGIQKVIIVAHSMGGLVSREYIQHTNLYDHDVAKLVTFDTPHLGSNHGDIEELIYFDLNYDPQCDGARDLRFCRQPFPNKNQKSVGPEPPYGDYPDNAVYLFGGTEDPSLWNLGYDWYSYDFNGDGIENNSVING